jgi:hypothetical protein
MEAEIIGVVLGVGLVTLVGTGLFLKALERICRPRSRSQKKAGFLAS